jgi:lipopolysaccharide export system protein LptC
MTSTGASSTALVRKPKPPHLQRRTRVVAAMRLILPATAALLLATLALWSRFGLDTTSFRLGLGDLDVGNVNSLSMSNAHFEGIDQKKRPFTVSADKAIEVDEASDIIDLVSPQADMTLEDGAWLSLIADSGRLRRSKKLLDLTGQVDLFHDQGYELHTRNVHVDLATNSAEGHDAVQGQGPSGELTADGLQVQNSGTRITFLGHAHMLFYGNSQSAQVPKP